MSVCVRVRVCVCVCVSSAEIGRKQLTIIHSIALQERKESVGAGGEGR